MIPERDYDTRIRWFPARRRHAAQIGDAATDGSTPGSPVFPTRGHDEGIFATDGVSEFVRHRKTGPDRVPQDAISTTLTGISYHEPMQDLANDSVADSTHTTERRHNQFSLRRMLVMMFACSLSCGIGALSGMYAGSVMTLLILVAAVFVVPTETRRTMLIVLICVYVPYSWWLAAAAWKPLRLW